MNHWLFYSKPIAQVYDRRRNSFNMLRLLFAMGVLYTHSIVLFGAGGDFIAKLTHQQTDIATCSVWGFFGISGFLVTQSIMSSPGYLSYFVKRALRILPAFLFSLFFFAFVVGPFLSEMAAVHYFFDPQGISPFEFVWKNIIMNIGGNYAWGVRDLFANNPFKTSVNGSMWTLKFEVACYIFLSILMLFRIFRTRILLLWVAFAVFMQIVLKQELGFMVAHLRYQWWILSQAEFPKLLVFLFLFLYGSICYVYQDRILLSGFFALLALLLLFFSSYFHILRYSLLLAWPYLVIFIGVHWSDPVIYKNTDLSYGVYIFSFPIMQTIFHLFGTKLVWPSYLGLCTLITFAFAFFSWNYIEKPALRLKSVLSGVTVR